VLFFWGGGGKSSCESAEVGGGQPACRAVRGYQRYTGCKEGAVGSHLLGQLRMPIGAPRWSWRVRQGRLWMGVCSKIMFF
jgi:hypothetical protein